MACTQNIKLFLWRKHVVRSLYTMEPACLVCRSSEYLTQGSGGLSLSHRWSLIRPHTVRRGKGSAVASLSLSHHWSVIRPHPVRRGKGSAVASLSLSPLVTDPVASCRRG